MEADLVAFLLADNADFEADLRDHKAGLPMTRTLSWEDFLKEREAAKQLWRKTASK